MSRRPTRILRACVPVGVALCLAAASLLPGGRAAVQAPGQGGPVAKTKELLARAPFDRITLIDDTTWEIEPLAPRPLPPFDPKKKAREKRAADPRPQQGNIGTLTTKSTLEAAIPKEDEGAFQVIHLLDGDVRDFKVKREHIKSVAYFEDLLIEEAGRLIAAGNYPKAFEYILAAKSRQPAWPKLDDTVDRLLFEEGSAAFIEGDGERGLRLLGDLHGRRPAYPGLGDKLASSFGARIRAAFDVGAFAKGRQVLHELGRILPDHLAVRDARGLFEGRAGELAGRASKAAGPERLDLLLAAAQVWPTLPGLESSYREAFAAVPTLDVAVVSLPSPVGPWNRSAASSRTSRLLYRPILAALTDEALKGGPPDQLASSVEPFDLSRGLRIKLKPGFTWSDGSRPVSAIDVARSLADRTVPTLPGYSARWADLLERVEASTEDDAVEVHLTRPSFRPESWLLAPVGPAHAAGDGWVSSVGQGRRPVGDGPYRWLASSGGADQYVASPVPGGPGPKVKRVREVRYGSTTAAIAALVGGEVSLLEGLPPDRVAELGAAEGVLVGRYATPSLHRVALDGRTEALRNRSLRRALSMAIDRRMLLEEVVLRRPPGGEDDVADGPTLKGSYADAADVRPLDYNPLLANMLVAAAKKELGGGVVRLTLEYPSTPVAQAVCPRLAEAWTLVGIEVVLKELPEADLEARLRAGGRFDLAYRSSRPGEPAAEVGPTICPGYDAPASADPLASVASPSILQLLLQLDRAPEATASQSLLRQIDRESRDELPILPLWQLVDHLAWRARLKGPSGEVRALYEGIESWEVEPWFPRDPW